MFNGMKDYGYQQESRVSMVVPPCKKEYDEIEKANEITKSQTSIYNRFSAMQDLPECESDGFYSALQCSTKSR